MKMFLRGIFLVTMAVAPAFAEGPSYASGTQAAVQIQSALREHDVNKAWALVQQALKSFPDDQGLRVELARIYVYQRHERRAIEVLEDILHNAPSNRGAKVELARVLGYRGDYKKSDRLYREVLASDASDEAASMGLARNLIHEGRRDEALREVRQALQLHPNSLGLSQYSDFLLQSQGSQKEVRKASIGRIQTGESYFSDSAGNRSLRSSQTFQLQVNRVVSTRLNVEERSLWKVGIAPVNVWSGTNNLYLQLNKFVSFVAEGGAVRFADTRSRSIYAGDVQLRPFKILTLSGGYSRFPINPTFESASFDLLAQGWHNRLDLRSKNFALSGGFSQSHYSDGNRVEREAAEVMRWIGGPSLGFGAGYSFNHLHFTQDLNHGYFSPRQYRSHLAEAGFRFQIGRVFRAEYLGLGGTESFADGSSNPAGEVILKNQVLLGPWDLGLSYSRYQVAQNTGAFQANSGIVTLGYRF